MSEFRRATAFTASVALHVGVLFVGSLVTAPVERLKSEDPESLRKNAVLIWYPPRTPDIAPRQSTTQVKSPLPPEVPESRKTVTVTNADKVRRQMIWQQQAPKVELNREQPAPNIVELNSAALQVTPPPPPPTPKQFVPPTIAQKPAAVVRKKDDTEAPPAVANSSVATRVNQVIMGLDPVAAPVPVGNLRSAVVARPEDKAAAPNASPDGGRNQKGLSAPEVIVSGGNPKVGAVSSPPPPVITAPVKPVPKATPEQRARAAARASVSAPLRGAARVVPRFVDSFFGTQTIYTTVLDIPPESISTRVSNAILWFADAQTGSTSSMLVRAPVVILGAAMADAPPKGAKAYVKLWIGKDGLVRTADLLAPTGEAWGQVLQKLVTQWEFAPAIRIVEPIEITAIMELSF